MQFITSEQATDFFELVTIEQSIDLGHTITHICNAGTADQPCRFVIVNDTSGRSVVAPAFFK